jgi:hypothetical protein
VGASVFPGRDHFASEAEDLQVEDRECWRLLTEGFEVLLLLPGELYGVGPSTGHGPSYFWPLELVNVHVSDVLSRAECAQSAVTRNRAARRPSEIANIAARSFHVVSTVGV